MPIPDGRILFALDPDDTSLTWSPTWTALDDEYPSLVTSYTIDRGRQYELDHTDTGRATVEIADVEGVLDPTNAGGPFYGAIEALIQAMIRRYNPVSDTWETRFRGFVSDYDYAFDPSMRVNRLTVQLVDLFEFLAAIDMYPTTFGHDPAAGGSGVTDPSELDDQVWFGPTVDGQPFDERIRAIIEQALIPNDYRIVFSGNVDVQATTYSPGESALSAIQETADAEFPGVSNVYCDRHGRICVHGRLAKFDPAGTVASLDDPSNWDFHEFDAGDGFWVASSPPTYAHLREFAFNRGLSKVINQGLATPKNAPDGSLEAQVVDDLTSQGLRGIRSWSALNLITQAGNLTPATNALEETKRFALYYVNNYAIPRNRITAISFRSIDPSSPGASETWRLVSQVDISDYITVSVGSPGGGGFDHDPYFVEGIHESSAPANPLYDDVTVSLDLSPQAYFTGYNPWEEE